MNKIIASTGLVALGAASLHAAYAPGVSAQDTAKSWSLHGGVQGFYDSNNTLASDGNEQESWGVGFDIGAGYNLPLDQTFLGVDYTYGLKWYEARADNNTDQTHIFNLKLEHAFSERYDVSLKDSFVLSSEPTVLDAGGTVTAPTRTLRSDQDNWRNRANLDFGAQFSEKWGATIGYENMIYDYKQDAADVGGSGGFASRSQLLDRMQHLIPIDGRYTVNPKLVALAGYQFGMTDYMSDESYIWNGDTSGNTIVSPDWRNTQNHYLYVGAEYAVSSQLNTALRAGARHTKYDNLGDVAGTSNLDDTQLTPYVDLSASYLYNPGSYVTGGYRYDLSATDVQVLNNKTHVVYVSLTHKITSRVDVNLLYQYQNSNFNFNDNIDGSGGESFNIFGLDFDYKITEYLSAQLGYKFDDLSSDVPNRSYNRHIGFLGLRANY